MPLFWAHRSPFPVIETIKNTGMSRFTSRLLAWYRQQGRTLPWRDHPDPYAVWVSEIMLQQTRVETVIPYFKKWMRSFPTIKKLAQASEQDVLNAWEGLGYYSRARNLHNAAKIVLEKHNGEMPRNLDELRALPGIGRYTVGAIASMAFGMDEPTLDGNIRRVYARLFDVIEPADSATGEKILWGLAAKYLPKGQARDYNQALMDLGATICIPRNPQCLICPLMQVCEARQAGTQEQRPVLKPKKAIPHYTSASGVIVNRGRVLLSQRPSKGLLGSMWEFPNGRVEGEPAKELVDVLKTGYGLKALKKQALDIVNHTYSHFSVTVHPFMCELTQVSENKNLRWVKLTELGEYPMGRIDRQIARQIEKRKR
jgi:A/G-specific adenine glycosylase